MKNLNTNQKIVWTVYIIVFVALAIASSNYSVEQETFNSYLFLGWIPALMLHKMWRSK